jgi:ABC-2 type transport system permease protein
MSVVATAWIVARKEFTEMIRDGRLRLLAILVAVLGIAALGFGARHTVEAQDERSDAMERARGQWEGQGAKNPHVAAHYGTYVFAPISVVSAIDPGVSAQLGRSIKMVAHKQNLPDHATAKDSGASAQMGGFSVSIILLKLVPLLIIALGYGMWSRERERGTLRQILSTGVSRAGLFYGKCLALLGIIAALLIPASLIVIVVLSALGGFDNQVLWRLLWLSLSYGVYFSIFAALTLTISALARTSQGALVTLVTIWGLFCLLLPRAAVESATHHEPLPSPAAFHRQVKESLATGIDGQAEREAAVDALVKDLLAKQGFANAGFMLDPATARGAELRAEAKWEDMVFDHHIGALNASIKQQEQHYAGFGLLSPYVAMSAVSKALCGTDFEHHQDFSRAGERWRKSFVEMLNKTFVQESGAEGWNYKAGPEVWSKAPPFIYKSPTVSFALNQIWKPMFSLVIWLMICFGLAGYFTHRMKVV